MSPTASAQVTSPASAECDSDSDELAHAFDNMSTIQTKNDEFGYKDYVAECTVDRIITEETIPKYEKLAKTAMVADKYCLICLKSDMDLGKLSIHLSSFHSIAFDGEDYDDSAEDWIFADTVWKEQGSTMPITSESENEEPEDASDKEQEESTVVPQLPPSIIREFRQFI